MHLDTRGFESRIVERRFISRPWEVVCRYTWLGGNSHHARGLRHNRTCYARSRYLIAIDIRFERCASEHTDEVIPRPGRKSVGLIDFVECASLANPEDNGILL